MLPEFNAEGLLPPGIHPATWAEVEAKLGFTPKRQTLLRGLKRAISALHSAGCGRVPRRSFVTSKPTPGDFDACWEEAGVDAARLDPVLLDFKDKRLRQKVKYGGEMFPASSVADRRGTNFVSFFQVHKGSGSPKGIVSIDLEKWQP
ncbi:MAG: hypothetical protein IPI49_01265 [Myxococcales bacterium]|nr:hypothetical protein [Myxococcales bacterium]